MQSAFLQTYRPETNRPKSAATQSSMIRTLISRQRNPIYLIVQYFMISFTTISQSGYSFMHGGKKNKVDIRWVVFLFLMLYFSFARKYYTDVGKVLMKPPPRGSLPLTCGGLPNPRASVGYPLRDLLPMY